MATTGDLPVLDTRTTSSTSPFNLDIPLNILPGQPYDNCAFRAVIEVTTYNTAITSYSSYSLVVGLWTITAGVLAVRWGTTNVVAAVGTAPTITLPAPPDNATLRITITPAQASSTKHATSIRVLAYT